MPEMAMALANKHHHFNLRLFFLLFPPFASPKQTFVKTSNPMTSLAPPLVCCTSHKNICDKNQMAGSTSPLEEFMETFGPSLQRGRKPQLAGGEHSYLYNSHDAKGHESEVGPASHYSESDMLLVDSGKKRLNRFDFVRVYDVAALRVPADECGTLVHRLQGHLLNWPRIRNVARVPGDDIDYSLKDFLWGDGGERSASSLRSAVYGVKELELKPKGIAKRVELVEAFERHGPRNFQNIERMSRPKPTKKSTTARDKEILSRNDKKDSWYTVEVAEETDEDSEEGLADLLDGELGRKIWTAPTRLLLLDERYAGKLVSELPMAVQVLLKQSELSAGKLERAIVQCKLTIFYEYWKMDEILQELLPRGASIPNAFETVGHIAHLNLRDEHIPYRHLIAQVVLDKHKPRIQTVVNKTDSISSQYRTMQLEILAGNHSLVTTVMEHGTQFHVNLATVYWNSRLATERQRLLQSFNDKDILCDVFAGVGPIAVAAAKKVKRVYANDLNPSALTYLSKNISENKLQAKVEIFNFDGRKFIKTVLAFDKPVLMTQVVMNLPTDATEFLDAFVGAFNKDTWGATRSMPIINLYGFSKAPDPEADFEEAPTIGSVADFLNPQLHCTTATFYCKTKPSQGSGGVK